MFKKMKNEPLTVLCIVLWLAFFVIAAKPASMTGLTSLWVGDQTVTSDTITSNTKGYGHFTGKVEVDGTTRLDGNVDVNADMDVSGTFTNTTTRSFALQLAAGGVDSGNDVDSTANPALTSEDGIPMIVWTTSAETTAVGWTFRLPSDFSSDLVVYALVSSDASNATPSTQILDWAVFVNIDGTAFDSSPYPQAGVSPTETALDTKNDVLEFTSDATAENAYVAGRWITLEWFNQSTTDHDMEIKGLEVTYKATS